MSENNQQPVVDENRASQRHWLYGFNAFVLVVVGLVVLIILLVICQTPKVKNATKFDWSSNKVNSLSGGSQKMLQVLNAKPEKYLIWSLFTDAPDSVKRDAPDRAAEQARRRQQINDLLQQYTRASGNISVDDRGDASMDEIERLIRDKYAEEFKPYQAAMDGEDGYGALVSKLSKFLKNEAAAIGANGQKPGTPQSEIEMAAGLQAQFSDWPYDLEQSQKIIQRETDSVLPDWGKIKMAINTIVDDMEVKFSILSDPKELEARAAAKRFPPTLAAYFISANKDYKDIEASLKAFQKKLADLQPLKVQDVLGGLTRNIVIILGDKSAKVVPPNKLYGEAAPGQGGLVFNGEQAISSALYAMVKPDKVKIVFVTPSPQQMLDGMYSDMKDVLEDNNFEVLEWSPPTPPQPGQPPDPSGPPPAIGKGVVWVVFTPDPPSMMMMMPPDPRGVIMATREHMDKGGQVLFMADGGGGMMMGPQGFAYASLIKDFGIEVQSQYGVVHVQERTDPNTGRSAPQNNPYIGLDQPLIFAKHQITTPVNGLPTVFGPIMSDRGSPPMATLVPVKVLEPLPSGVTALEIVKSPYSPDYWGESDSSAPPKYNKESDLAAPIPLMAVAVKEKAPDGSADEKRIAVIGCKMLGSNYFLRVPDVVTRGDIEYQVQRFPGNMELMKNTVLWLSGYENMIAVSAKANTAARIGGVTPTQMTLVRLGVLLVAPLLALVIGGIVWTMRRR